MNAADEARSGGARPPVGLYVHVPFCVSVCPYCDFVVYPGAAARGPRSSVPAFIRAVTSELRLRADALDRRWGPSGEGVRPPLASLYLGGGTPSLLPADAIADLVALVRERFGLAPGAEVTLEANPGRDERGDARAQVAAGVTRLSVGAQALDDTTLRALGRRHRTADVTDTIAAAREARIPSVSLDLLYDLPDQSVGAWERTIEAALALGPEHLSLYAVALDDPATAGVTDALGDRLELRRGARRWRDRARGRQDEDRAARMYEVATERLAAGGYRGYEISNWARPGHESRHNLAYWRRLPVEAVGPGAHAFDGAVRRWNGPRLDAYLAAGDPGPGRDAVLPPGGFERLDDPAAAAEAMILGLRTDEGVPAAAVTRPDFEAAIRWGIDEGLVAPSGDRFALTTRGRLLSDELFARLV